ncbi:MAG: DinB family protein [Chloroflexota bacterium]|nr:DinB family protein [Chloroflexota bacterium]
MAAEETDTLGEATTATPEAVAPESPRAAIRTELEATQAALHRLLDSLDEAAWQQPSGDPAWTVGEQLAQAADELALVPRTVAAARTGRDFSPPQARGVTRAINTRTTRMMVRHATRESVRAKYDAAYSAVCAALDGVAEEDWERGATFFGEYQTVADVFRRVQADFDRHAAAVAQGLGRPQLPG